VVAAVYDAAMKARGFLADAVQGAEGKLSALGAGWNHLGAPGFPARHDRIGIGLILTFEIAEAGQHNVEIQLLGPNDLPTLLGAGPGGAEQYAITAMLEVGRPQDGSAEVSIPMAINLDGLMFSEPGSYAFAIRVDGQDAERLNFAVGLSGQDDAAQGGTSSGRPAGDAGYL
jgi:hypothetical protein